MSTIHWCISALFFIKNWETSVSSFVWQHLTASICEVCIHTLFCLDLSCRITQTAVKHKWIFWHSLTCASTHKHTHPSSYSTYSPRAPWQISVRVAPPTMNWGLFDSSCKHYASKYTSAKVWYSPCQPNNTLYTSLHINHIIKHLHHTPARWTQCLCLWYMRCKQVHTYIEQVGYCQFANENIVWVWQWYTGWDKYNTPWWFNEEITLLAACMKKLNILN